MLEGNKYEGSVAGGVGKALSWTVRIGLWKWNWDVLKNRRTTGVVRWLEMFDDDEDEAG